MIPRRGFLAALAAIAVCPTKAIQSTPFCGISKVGKKYICVTYDFSEVTPDGRWTSSERVSGKWVVYNFCS